MRQTIFVSLTFLYIFRAHALKVDLDCVPARAWDTGYEIEALKMEDDSYQATLNAQAIYGRIGKYKGEVILNPVMESSDCLVDIQTIDFDGEPFELQVKDNGDAILLSVSDAPVKEYVREMICNRSDKFIADQKTICGDVRDLARLVHF